MKKVGILKKVLHFADSAILGGAIQNRNSKTKDHPEGKTNWVHLAGGIVSSIALLVLLYLLVTGKINYSEFMEGIDSVKDI